MALSKRRMAITSAVLAGFSWLVASDSGLAQGTKHGNPEENLQPNIQRLTDFGERASWSPDGKRVAFVDKSFGNAYEVEVATRAVRPLTKHFQHAGFLRIQYLPSGDFLLIGARTFRDIKITRAEDQEFWLLESRAEKPPMPLEQRVSEGVAISRSRMRIAWSNTHGQYPEEIPSGVSVLYVADLEPRDGRPVLRNKREVLREQGPRCVLEAQDFRNDDSELVYTCYRNPYADVLGLDLATGKRTTYRQLEAEYNEAEGISPDGRWVLVESSREQGADRQDSRYIDIWRLTLEPQSQDFTRLTRWGVYKGYKASNPVVSPDGNTIAFQSARSNEPAGVGHGIFLLDLGQKEPLK